MLQFTVTSLRSSFHPEYFNLNAPRFLQSPSRYSSSLLFFSVLEACEAVAQAFAVIFLSFQMRFSQFAVHSEPLLGRHPVFLQSTFSLVRCLHSALLFGRRPVFFSSLFSPSRCVYFLFFSFLRGLLGRKSVFCGHFLSFQMRFSSLLVFSL